MNNVCDTSDDLTTIDPQYINLGSAAIVLHGAAGLELYMADSNKQWVPLIGSAPSSDEEGP